MDFVVEFEHLPELCPHSNAIARKQFEGFAGAHRQATESGIELVFAGIAAPGHKTYMVLRAADFNAVRDFFVKSGIVQTNTVDIHVTESLEEFAEDLKKTTPMF